MTDPKAPRKRRRAVGPPGARPAVDEPLPEVEEREADDRQTLERYLADRPPHHEPH